MAELARTLASDEEPLLGRRATHEQECTRQRVADRRPHPVRESLRQIGLEGGGQPAQQCQWDRARRVEGGGQPVNLGSGGERQSPRVGIGRGRVREHNGRQLGVGGRLGRVEPFLDHRTPPAEMVEHVTIEIRGRTRFRITPIEHPKRLEDGLVAQPCAGSHVIDRKAPAAGHACPPIGVDAVSHRAGADDDHRAGSVAYGAGLRAVEVVSLKPSDIDSQRMVIRVEQGKGRKDRYAKLSDPLLDILRAWWRAGRERGKMLPGGWLFPGQNPVNPLTTRQLNRAFHDAREAAGIDRPVVGIEVRRAQP